MRPLRVIVTPLATDGRHAIAHVLSSRPAPIRPLASPGAGRAKPGFVPESPALNLSGQICTSSRDWTDLFPWLST